MMLSLLFRSLPLYTFLLLTPFVLTAQANTDYAFSSSQFCVVDDAGLLECTASGGYQRLLPPDNLPALRAVTVGQAHACGITIDGQPVCWGGNFFGQLDVPVFNAPLAHIDAGADHTCAIDTNNEAKCWGLNTNLQLDVPAGSTFSQVDAAQLESCGVLSNGDLTCWSDDPRRAPHGLTGSFSKIDLRSGAVCGLTTDGQIECADNSVVDVPIRPVTPYITPPDNGPYTDMAATHFAVCGLLSDGALDCAFESSALANERDSVFPLGEKFTSIRSNDTDILVSTREIVSGNFMYLISGSAMCGERLDGTIDCWDQGAVFPDINGTSNSNAALVQSLELDLDARVYGARSVELFWTPLPFNSVGANDIQQPIVEIYRNGELIASETVRFSYFDKNAVPQADYQIRLVDEAGNAGPLSGVLSVNVDDRSVIFNGEPTLQNSDLDLEVLPNVFTEINAADLSLGIVIAWEVDPAIESSIDGYDIRVNGSPAGFTRSQLFVDTITPFAGRCVEITAIGFDQSALGASRHGRGCQ